MKILLVHNHYQQPGGEDVVFAAEVDLLRGHGHEVICYTDDNQRIPQLNRLNLAARTIWSHETYLRLSRILSANHFDVAHFHNTFPLISPSAYDACRKAGVPIVQTLHNYRLLCPAATFYRDGQICEKCLERKFPWPAILHGCYRDSRAQSAVAASMVGIHKWIRTWVNKVNVFLALTEFARAKFIEGGIPAEKIKVKPNFVYPDPGAREGLGEYALFVGRLAPGKGILALLEAWKELPHIPLKLVGDGPLKEAVQARVNLYELSDVTLLGSCTHENVFRLMKRARFMVVASECYEGFPMTIAEAFACATPVLAPRLGAMSEIVGKVGKELLFQPGNMGNLVSRAARLWSSTSQIRKLGSKARNEFELKYSCSATYVDLLHSYKPTKKNSLRKIASAPFVGYETPR